MLASHAYGDNGTYMATVTVTDNNGASDSDTFTVIISNVNPVMNPYLSLSIPEGYKQEVSLASFTDNGYKDTHIASINWGDGRIVHAVLNREYESIPNSNNFTLLRLIIWIMS